jgi:hypothetical protein
VNQESQHLMAVDSNLIKDQAQVMAMCQWASQLDNEGGLAALFDRPAGLSDDEVQTCIEQEGWILGAV